MQRGTLTKSIAAAAGGILVVSAMVFNAGILHVFPMLHTQAEVTEVPEDVSTSDASASDTETTAADKETTEADTERAAADTETKGTVEIVASEEEQLVEELLKEIPSRWDAFNIVTYFVAPFPSNFNSERNAKVAARYLNGTIIGSGKDFSYNETVGERTKGRGFITAPVIFGDQMDEDLGGGVCEISTMLYNICLQADLEVTERSPHTLQVPYVPGGMDAAVSWGARDFRFRNPYDEPLTIFTGYDNDAEKFIMILISRSGKELLGGTEYVPISEKTDDGDYSYHSYVQIRHNGNMTGQIDLGTTAYYGVDDAE